MAAPEAWYYQTDGQTFGPCSAADLKRLCQSGGLRPTHLVRPESREQWSPALKVRGLFPEAAALSAGKKLLGAAKLVGFKAVASVTEPTPAVTVSAAATIATNSPTLFAPALPKPEQMSGPNLPPRLPSGVPPS